MLSHVDREQIEENPPVVQFHLLHPVPLLFSLDTGNVPEVTSRSYQTKPIISLTHYRTRHSVSYLFNVKLGPGAVITEFQYKE